MQIPKSREEKSSRGSDFSRRFLSEDCRILPALNSPRADPNGPRGWFLETRAPLVISGIESSRLQETRGQITNGNVNLPSMRGAGYGKTVAIPSLERPKQLLDSVETAFKRLITGGVF